MALVVATNASLAVERVGLPEAELILSQAAIYLACAPKSNSVTVALDEAHKVVSDKGNQPIPVNLRDAHYPGAAELGHGVDYKYPHNYPNHWVAQQYLPDAIKSAKYYRYGDNKTEQAAAQYWEKIKHADED